MSTRAEPAVEARPDDVPVLSRARSSVEIPAQRHLRATPWACRDIRAVGAWLLMRCAALARTPRACKARGNGRRKALDALCVLLGMVGRTLSCGHGRAIVTSTPARPCGGDVRRSALMASSKSAQEVIPRSLRPWSLCFERTSVNASMTSSLIEVAAEPNVDGAARRACAARPAKRPAGLRRRDRAGASRRTTPRFGRRGASRPAGARPRRGRASAGRERAARSRPPRTGSTSGRARASCERLAAASSAGERSPTAPIGTWTVRNLTARRLRLRAVGRNRVGPLISRQPNAGPHQLIELDLRREVGTGGDRGYEKTRHRRGSTTPPSRSGFFSCPPPTSSGSLEGTWGWIVGAIVGCPAASLGRRRNEQEPQKPERPPRGSCSSGHARRSPS